MTTERPKTNLRRVVLIARALDEPVKSKAITLYDTTPEKVIKAFKKISDAEKQQPAPTAA